jgi:hypothetical protein
VFDLVYWGQGGFSFEQVWNMPVYMRRYYINKISDIHKKQEEASKGKSNDQKAMETLESFDIDWDNLPSDSGLNNEL